MNYLWMSVNLFSVSEDAVLPQKNAVSDHPKTKKTWFFTF